ncbi:unnamed protein product, partial [Symbiodinium necroappetens]
ATAVSVVKTLSASRGKTATEAQVFEAHPTEDSWGKIVPLMLHGDEGRGTWKSTLTSQHLAQTRYFLFGIACSVLKKNKHVTNAVFQKLVDNFNKLLSEGVEVPKMGRIYAAVVGVKGDLDFHLKYYDLVRSYSHVGSRQAGFICHACQASSGVNSQHPFDDFSEDPAWLQTMHQTRPWNATPILASVPYDDQRPEQVIVWDLLHVLKLGVGRYLIGGALILLLRKGFMDHAGDLKNILD